MVKICVGVLVTSHAFRRRKSIESFLHDAIRLLIASFAELIVFLFGLVLAYCDRNKVAVESITTRSYLCSFMSKSSWILKKSFHQQFRDLIVYFSMNVQKGYRIRKLHALAKEDRNEVEMRSVKQRLVTLYKQLYRCLWFNPGCYFIYSQMEFCQQNYCNIWIQRLCSSSGFWNPWRAKTKIGVLTRRKSSEGVKHKFSVVILQLDI